MAGCGGAGMVTPGAGDGACANAPVQTANPMIVSVLCFISFVFISFHKSRFILYFIRFEGFYISFFLFLFRRT
jgi:hypothetical protein